MTKYTVKNAAGEWLFYDYDLRSWGWTSLKEARDIWSRRRDAKRESRINGGKVYRVRRTSAKMERERVVSYLRRLAGDAKSRSFGAACATAAEAIESGEHMRKTKVQR